MEARSQSPSGDRRTSGTASAAQPKSLWRYIRSDLAWACGTVALTSLLLIPLMRLWRADLRVPFYYDGDALLYLMYNKSVLKHGWFLDNPDLGAPAGQELYDFPNLLGHSFNLLLIKLLGMLSPDPTLITNLFFLLSFPLIALASFLVLRQQKIGGAFALVCSMIYAFAPYHFLFGDTLHLAAYYTVPVGAYLVLNLLSGKPLFTRRTNTGPRALIWFSGRSLVTLLLCLLIAFSAGVYYVVFTGMLLVAATVLIFITQRDVRMLVQGTVLLVAIFGFLVLDSLPYLMYELENGPNLEVAQRGAQESDKYGLRLAQLVLPAPGHQIDALSNLAERYYENPKQAQSEGPGQALGFVTALGFVWLLLVALASCLSPRWRSGALRHRQLATATVIAFFIGTTGGLSTLFAYLVSPQIRSWDRISIFIAFFAIAAMALLLEALVERIRLRRGRQVLAGALLFSVLLVGLYDQSNSSFVPNYSAAKSQYESDAALVEAIDRELPSQAQVFQLPYMPFPESPPINELWDNELLKPYLHESDLRWSYGVVKGRPTAKWQEDLTDEGPNKLLSEVLAAGFDGIYIDRRGYPDHAAKLERRLGKELEVEPLVSLDGSKSFFSLLTYKERS
jgi:phosphoglycerol transferase